MADQTTDAIKVEISAQIKELLNPLKQAGDAVKDTTAGMRGAFSSLEGMFGSITKGFAAIGAVVAGGAMFKAAVNETIKWTSEANKLAKTLGITTQEASILNLALGDIYTDSSVYIGASNMLTKQINAGGEAFDKLGIKIRDAQGHLRPTTQIMGDVMGKLNQIEPGINRNAAGMSIFGRQWGEASKLLRLTSEAMEEAKKKAEDLNLVVGPEAAEKTKNYKAMMNDLEDIVMSLKVQIGNALMPVLVEFGVWLGKTGPAMAQGLAYSLKGIGSAFYVLKAIIENITNVIVAAIMTIVDGWALVGKVLWKVVQGDFKGAAQSAKEEAQNIRNEWAAAGEGIATSWKDAAGSIKNLWNETAANRPRKGGGEGETFDPGSGKDKGEDRMKQWTAALKTMQDELARDLLKTQGKFYEMSLSEERAYWVSRLALGDLSAKERAALEIKIADIDRAMRKEALQERLEGLKEEADANRQNLQVKRDAAVAESALYVEGTAAYKAAQRKIREIDREMDAERRALLKQQVQYTEEFDLMLVDLNIESIQRQAEFGQISQQEALASLQQFEQEKLEIKRKSLEAQLQDEKLGEEQRREIENRINLLTLEKRRLTNQQQAEMQRSFMDQMRDTFEPITQAWNQSITGMLNGSMRLSQGVQGIVKGMGRALDQAILQMVNSWIAAEFKKTMATQAGTLQRLAMESMAAVKSVGLAAWQAIKTIGIRAYEAAAGAYSAVASIPYVGPFLAPVMAGLAVAGVLAMGSKIASAAGGWHTVPQDQMAMIHKDEQVLPAKYAEGLRNLIEGGGSQQAPAFAPSFNITALDAKGVERVLRDNNSSVGRAMRDYARNFGRP